MFTIVIFLFCLIFITFLRYLVDELQSIEQYVFFTLAKMPIGSDVRFGLFRDLRDLTQVDPLFQTLQPL